MKRRALGPWCALEHSAPAASVVNEQDFVTFVRRQTAGWKGARMGPRGLIIGQRLFGRKTPVILVTQGENAEFLDVIDPERPVYLLRTLRKLAKKIRQENARVSCNLRG
jgi:hypothetical protein